MRDITTLAIDEYKQERVALLPKTVSNPRVNLHAKLETSRWLRLAAKRVRLWPACGVQSVGVMSSIQIQAETIIARPIEVVRAQFMDLAHHMDAGVHPTFQFSDVRKIEGGYRYKTSRRLLGVVHRDEYEQLVHGDGHVTSRVVAGTNEGLLLTDRFEAVEGGGTRVTATMELPVRGLLSLIAPLVRMGAQRDLRLALEQDRVDLEERGYSPS